MQQGVMTQVVGAQQGRGPCQQRRAAHGRHLHRQAQFGMQARVVTAPVAHFDIHIVALEVGHVLGRRYAQVDIRMPGHEALHAGDQPFHRERRRQIELERLRLPFALHPVGGLHQLAESLLDARQIGLARAGQDEGFGVAHEQGDPKIVLQHLDLVADGRRGDAQLLGRARKAEMARGDLEGAQRVQRRDGTGHEGFRVRLIVCRRLRNDINP